jgi:hypothetical protein
MTLVPEKREFGTFILMNYETFLKGGGAHSL